VARRVTPAQYRSMVNRAISDYNRAVRQHNAQVRRAVDGYNRQVRAVNREIRAHDARVVENRRRLRAAIAALNRSGSATITTRTTTYYTAVRVLHESYERVEESAPGTWLESRDDILDLAQAETANSVKLADAAGSTSAVAAPEVDPQVESRLRDFDDDLASRWSGALFALNERNPDAARHFSASCREILTQMIDRAAPDDEVLAAGSSARTPEGRPTRRAKLAYGLVRSGQASDELAAFADADVVEVIELFRVFNDGTHGDAAVFTHQHLRLIRARVEGAITFLHALLR
jgi:Predicted pPIWI-associating nuclease